MLAYTFITRSKRKKSSSSSILVHFLSVGRSNKDWFGSLGPSIDINYLQYISDLSTSVWIFVARCIVDAGARFHRDRTKYRSRLSSILDHFLNVGRSHVHFILIKWSANRTSIRCNMFLFCNYHLLLGSISYLLCYIH